MRRVVALVGSICLCLQGCTSMQTVPVPQTGSAPAAVQVGDTVEVTTHAGQVQRFQVTEVANDALVGEEIRIAYADMADLKAARRDEAKSRTTLWVIGGVALVALLVGAGGGGGGSGY